MSNKLDHYQKLILQIFELISCETDLIANLANICALLHTELQHHWTGFYITKNQTLILGPFQGSVACTQIPFGKGVCGTAAQQQISIIVPNVHEFPGHIACSSRSNSEIVVPLVINNQTQLVLDVDSLHFNQFDADDQKLFEAIMRKLAMQHYSKPSSESVQ